MKLRAQFIIDIDAADFRDAADHQQRLENFKSAMDAEYSRVAFTIRERRDPGTIRARVGSRPPFRTGNLHQYEEEE